MCEVSSFKVTSKLYYGLMIDHVSSSVETWRSAAFRDLNSEEADVSGWRVSVVFNAGCEGGGEGPAGYLGAPMRRGQSCGAVMSASGGAVEEVQELRGRGVGVHGVGGGGRSDL